MTLILFTLVALMYGLENMKKNAPPASTTLAPETSVIETAASSSGETRTETTKANATTTDGYVPGTASPETLP